MRIPFHKLHGSGNDFILVDEYKQLLVSEEDKPDFVRSVSDRHFGVGSDGVIFVQSSEKADIKFHFFNPDGSVAEMCGNGIRCFAKYVYEHKIIPKQKMNVETVSGILTTELAVHGKRVDQIKVDMGAPRLSRGNIPISGPTDSKMIEESVNIKGVEYVLTSVGMGNPHTVLFVEDVNQEDVIEHGREIRYYTELFPNGVNVHFVEQVGENEYKIRSYERGVESETLACGTGICAAAVAASLTGKADPINSLMFHALGGDLIVELESSDDGELVKVYLIGPAEEVFSGKIEYLL